MRSHGTAVAVWTIWTGMLLTAVLLVIYYGSNVPFRDDWDMVPTLTGNQPVTLSWLWSQHNEHRVPVPRILYLAVNHFTVVDFRSTMYFDVFLVAGTAAAMMLIARRLRGRTSLADVFFPVILLHWGHAYNLLWGWQIEYYLSVVLACVALLAIVQYGAGLTPRVAGIIVGVCAILLTLCGANGLGMVPVLALWPLALALLPSWSATETAPGARLALTLVSCTALVLSGPLLRWLGASARDHSHDPTRFRILESLRSHFSPAG